MDYAEFKTVRFNLVKNTVNFFKNIKVMAMY